MMLVILTSKSGGTSSVAVAVPGRRLWFAGSRCGVKLTTPKGLEGFLAHSARHPYSDIDFQMNAGDADSLQNKSEIVRDDSIADLKRDVSRE